MRVCNRCQNMIMESDDFCSFCGQKQTDSLKTESLSQNNGNMPLFSWDELIRAVEDE